MFQISIRGETMHIRLHCILNPTAAFAPVSLYHCLSLPTISLLLPLIPTHAFSLFLSILFWPHRRYSQAWREPINHSVQIKSQIIIIENNGFHVSFSSALNSSHTYLETRGLEAQRSSGTCAVLGWNSSYLWSNFDWISVMIKLLNLSTCLVKVLLSSVNSVNSACVFTINYEDGSQTEALQKWKTQYSTVGQLDCCYRTVLHCNLKLCCV